MQTIFARGAMGILVIATCLTQGCATAVSEEPLLAGAGVGSMEGFVINTESDAVMSAQNKCVRTISWNAEHTVAECNAVAKEPVPVQPGSALVSYNGRALFEFDSATLTSAGQAELDRLTAKLNAQDQIESIEVVGHADNVGTDAYNQKLSESRAASVKRHLLQSLNSVDVSAKGMGESAPVADNSTTAGRRLNRRVDVNIAAMVEQ